MSPLVFGVISAGVLVGLVTLRLRRLSACGLALALTVGLLAGVEVPVSAENNQDVPAASQVGSSDAADDSQLPEGVGTPPTPPEGAGTPPTPPTPPEGADHAPPTPTPPTPPPEEPQLPALPDAGEAPPVTLPVPGEPMEAVPAPSDLPPRPAPESTQSAEPMAERPIMPEDEMALWGEMVRTLGFVTDRGENWEQRTFAGRQAVMVYSEPTFVRSKTSAKMERISRKIVPNRKRKGEFRNELGNFGAYFPQRIGPAAGVRVWMNGDFVELRPHAKQSQKIKIDDNTALYPNVFRAADLRYVVGTNGVKEEIVLDSAKAGSRWEFTLDPHGRAVRLMDSGAIELTDPASGKVAATIPPPVMYDSAQQPSGDPAFSEAVAYELTPTRGGKYRLVVTADVGWLTDPARVYPVMIDPPLERQGWVTTDTYVQSTIRSTPKNGDTQLKVGYYDGSTGYTRSLVRFGLPGDVRQSQVAGAYMMAAAYHSATSRSWNVAAERILQDWPAGVVWDNQPGSVQWLGDKPACGRPECADSVKTPIWDVTETVRAWYRGEPNYGFRLRANPEASDWNSWTKFYSSETGAGPMLIIFVNRQAPAPLIVSPTGGERIELSQPTLSVNPVSDPDGDPVYVRYQVAADPGFSNVVSDSSYMASAQLGSPWRWTVPADKLRPGNTYWWRALVCDGSFCDSEQVFSRTESFVFAPTNLGFGENQHWAVWTEDVSETVRLGVNQSTGNAVVEATGPVFKTTTDEIAVKFTYNSQAPADTVDWGLGRNWTVSAGSLIDNSSIPVRLFDDVYQVRIQQGDGGIASLPRRGDKDFAAIGSGDVVLKTDDGFVYETEVGSRYIFGTDGRLRSAEAVVQRKVGAKVEYTITDGRVNEIREFDANGNRTNRALIFGYTGGRLERIYEHLDRDATNTPETATRTWSLDVNPSYGLRKIDGPEGPVASFGYERQKMQYQPYGGFGGGVRVAAGDIDGDGSLEAITGAGPGGGPDVKAVTTDGYARTVARFYAYGSFSGGVDVAAGDVDGDGKDEIITGAGPGGGPHVRVLRKDGSEVAGWLAYGSAFSGGVWVAAGDVDGDGKDEVITGAGPGGGPHVRIFKLNGSSVTPIGDFFPYGSFSGGVDVAAGDVDGDGKDEIITGAGPGGGPHVRVFKANGVAIADLFPYPDGFTGGVRVSTLDRDSDGRSEIVTGAGPGGGPHVRLFRLNDQREFKSTGEDFFTFGDNHSGGVDVGGMDGVMLLGKLTGTADVRTWEGASGETSGVLLSEIRDGESACTGNCQPGLATHIGYESKGPGAATPFATAITEANPDTPEVKYPYSWLFGYDVPMGGYYSSTTTLTDPRCQAGEQAYCVTTTRLDAAHHAIEVTTPVEFIAADTNGNKTLDAGESPARWRAKFNDQSQLLWERKPETDRQHQAETAKLPDVHSTEYYYDESTPARPLVAVTQPEVTDETGKQVRYRSVTETDGSMSGLQARYWAGASDHKFRGVPTAVRTEPVVGLTGANWPEGVGPNDVSVRWSGWFTAPTTGTYKFRTYTDDGARLSVGGRTIVDQWHDQGATPHDGEVYLAAGQHWLVMEYYQGGGGAIARLEWMDEGQYKQVPSSLLRPGWNLPTARYATVARGDFAVPKAALAPFGDFGGGVRVAWGDTDGDGSSELITGAGPGGGPHVKVQRRDGKSIGNFFPYDLAFRGGVDVAAGDIDGDGKDEIITGAGAGGGPHVRIFRSDGTAVGGFFAYDGAFRGGVNVAAGDVDGDGRDEIITGAGPSGGPHVRIFRSDGTAVGGFFAYDGAFTGGVDVAAGDIDGDGRDEIITGAGAGGGPHVRIFRSDGTAVGGFFAYDGAFRGGVRVSARDHDGDGKDEIITAPATGGGPHVRLCRPDGASVATWWADGLSGGLDVAGAPDAVAVGTFTRSSSVRMYSDATKPTAGDTIGAREEFFYDRPETAQLTRTRTIADGKTIETSRLHDPLGRITQETDAAGYKTNYDYDVTTGWQKATSAQVVSGGPFEMRSEVSQWDLAGNVISESDGNGAESVEKRYVFDGMDRKVKETIVNGDRDITTTTTYDKAGNKRSVTRRVDDVDRTVTYRYDGRNRVREVEAPDPDGSGLMLAPLSRYSYDAANNKTHTYQRQDSTEPVLVQKLAYDANNRVVGVADAMGATTQFDYDASDRVIHTIAPGQQRSSVAYDALGRKTQISATYLPSVNSAVVTATATTTYDFRGNPVTVTDARSKVTQNSYDGFGRLLRTQSPGGGQVRYSYDSRGNTTSTQMLISGDPDGPLGLWNRAEADYDGLERQIVQRIGDPDGTGPLAQTQVNTTYDSLGRIKTETAPHVQGDDPGPYTTTFVYDKAGLLAEKHMPEGIVERYSYNEAGELIRFVDGEGNPTIRNYYSTGALASLRVPQASRAETYSYDAAGRLRAKTDTAGQMWQSEYRPDGRISAEVTPPVDLADGQAAPSVMSYDYEYVSTGEIRTTTNGNGHVTKSYTDPVGRLLATEVLSDTDPSVALSRATYRYDPAGNLTEARVPVDSDFTHDHVKAFGYNDAGNRDTYIDGEGHKTTFGYNKANWLTKQATDGVATAVLYDYDTLGRKTARGWEQDGSKDATWTERFSYDTSGRLKSAADTETKVATELSYDFVGRLRNVRQGAQESTYSYDQASRLTSRTDVTGTATFDYEPALGCQDGGTCGLLNKATIAGSTYRYSYDSGSGRLRRRDNPNGSYYNYEYDKLGHKSSEQLIDVSGNTLVNYAWTYDLGGHFATWKSDIAGDPSNGTHVYDYDEAGRLTNWARPDGQSGIYRYDPAGNMTYRAEPAVEPANVVTQSFDQADRLATRTTGGVTDAYAYSADGNLDTISRAGSVLWDYDYDPYGQLIQASGQAQTITYSYDALDRTVERQQATSTTTYAYDGLTHEPVRTVQGATELQYLRGASGELVAYTDSAQGGLNQLTMVGTNHHGDITYTVGPAGEITSTRNYTPYGQVWSRSGTDSLDLGFQGDITDPATGFVDMGARLYDPGSGAFTTQDPLQYLDTSSVAGLNLYGYANANPVDNIDPDGHAPWDWAKDKLKAGARWATSKAKAVGRNLGQKLSAARTWVSRQVRRVVAAVTQVVANVAQTVRRAARVAKQAASRALGAAKSAAGEAGGAVGRLARNIGGGFVDQAKGLWNTVAHPIEAVKAHFASLGDPFTLLRFAEIATPMSFGHSPMTDNMQNQLACHGDRGCVFDRGTRQLGGELFDLALMAATYGATKGLGKAMGSLGRSAPEAAGAADDGVQVFRVVEPAEAADIAKTGAYRTIPGQEGKYFFPTAEQGKNLAGMFNKSGMGGPYCLTSGCIPRSLLSKADAIHPAGEGAAWFIPEELLPHIKNVQNHGPVP